MPQDRGTPILGAQLTVPENDQKRIVRPGGQVTNPQIAPELLSFGASSAQVFWTVGDDQCRRRRQRSFERYRQNELGEPESVLTQ